MEQLKVTSLALEKMKAEYDSCHVAELEAKLALEQAHRNEEEVRAELGTIRGDLEEARGRIRGLQLKAQDQEGCLREMT